MFLWKRRLVEGCEMQKEGQKERLVPYLSSEGVGSRVNDQGNQFVNSSLQVRCSILSVYGRDEFESILEQGTQAHIIIKRNGIYNRQLAIENLVIIFLRSVVSQIPSTKIFEHRGCSTQQTPAK